MGLPLLAALVVLAAGQVADAADAARGAAPAVEAAPSAEQPGPPGEARSPLWSSGVLGWSWTGARPQGGLRLETGAMSQVRVHSLALAGGKPGVTSELDLVPSVALASESHLGAASAGYAPRLYVPAFLNGGPLSVLHRLSARGDWRTSPRATWAGLLSAMAGDYSQLVPAAPPGGPLEPAEPLDPVRTFLTYRYLSVNATGRLTWQATPSSTLRTSLTYADVGGLGEVGRQSQPRAAGPRLELLYDQRLDPVSSLATSAAASATFTDGGEVGLASLTSGWKVRWPSGLETHLGGGAAGTTARAATGLAVGRFLPMARLVVGWTPATRSAVRFAGELDLAPYVDAYVREAYDRVTLRASADWDPAPSWRVESFVSAAAVPRRGQPDEAYGMGGGSVAWAPGPVFTFRAGAFVQRQVEGPSGGGQYLQWTTYLSASVRRSEPL